MPIVVGDNWWFAASDEFYATILAHPDLNNPERRPDMPKTDLDTALGGDDPERTLAGEFRDELLALCRRYERRGLSGLTNVRLTSILAGEDAGAQGQAPAEDTVMSRFKVGDRVVCTRGDSDLGLYDGQEYTVEGVDTGWGEDLIGVRAGGALVYMRHSRFKTGDLVVCTNAERMEDHVTEGAHYVVVSTEWNAVWPAHERETLQVRKVDTLGPTPSAYAHRFEPATETKEEMLLKTITDLRERLAVTRHSERTKVEYINYLRKNDLIRDGRPEPKVEREPDVEARPRPETLAWLGACPEDTVRSLTYYVDDVKIEYKEDRR